MSTAVLFDIQRFSLHDGPGIRTTVFLKGCPLRCAWCHNPESMDHRPQPMLNEARCLTCGECAPVCEPGIAGPLMEGIGPVDAACTRCGSCAEECPSEARRMVGQEWTVDALMAELQKDAPYHDSSRGGVTFSGGEPLTRRNAPFVLECLRRLRAEGRHTVVDTCGMVDFAILQEAAQLADLVFFDLKIMDEALHERATGMGNRKILKNLSLLLDAGADMRVRVPLIPGYTDDEENLNDLADHLLSLRRVPPVDLLPYHGTGRDKYPRLGQVYEPGNTPDMKKDTLERRAEHLRSRGLEVEI